MTPDATDPDHDGYIAYDYADLVSTLESLITKPIEPVPSETQLIISHYIDLVRRHIVTDERLRSLAVKLYERHKEAFDFVFDCRPQPHSLLSIARLCVEAVEGLSIESSGANLLRFAPDIWDSQLQVIKGDPTKWSKTGRGLLFEIKTYASIPGRVNISLTLGPGDANMRAEVYRMATANPQLFKGLSKPMGAQWSSIFSRDFLTATQAKGLSFEAQEANVRLAWSDFLGGQLPALINGVLEIDERLASSQSSVSIETQSSFTGA
ncbi:hypothetical protein [Rhizobium phaseoli]|uniref:hypothetical protein n=1 Tax=Rhizobium phaseoli TaxID=396 RepID=UPI00167FFFF1|nr:hypothetical protein [Rhizobium phaseoli]